MAITRAQQAKQLLALGGRIGLQGGGADMGGVADSQGNVGGGSEDNRDRGRERSMQAAQSRAKAKADAALGDPDQEVDVLTKNRRDTITNYGKNLSARFRSNPFSVGPFGILDNIRQTQKAREMLGLSNDPSNFETEEDGDNELIPVDTTFANAPVTSAPAVSPDTGANLNRIAYRLMADGGAVIDDEPRQAYGLGSIVKKATRAVKKVAKSDIGKAALTAAAIYYAPAAFGGTTGFGAGSTYGNFFSNAKLGVGNFFRTKGLPNLAKGQIGVDKFGNAIYNRAAQSAGMSLGTKAGLGIAALSALPLLGVGVEEDEEENEGLSPYLGENLDIAAIRANPRAFQGQAYRLMAEGGDTEDAKEPVAKKVMPLLDMDGMEKDYREDGGFVPIGRMEKADDVPARLSKNEFVFTADAVRNAGDGSVDKGAEVMYNMMKNLEAGGEVSEESQGLEGARKMFQTSQRLEEVL